MHKLKKHMMDNQYHIFSFIKIWKSIRNKISGKLKNYLSTIRDGVESIPHTFDQIEFYVQKPVWYLLVMKFHMRKMCVPGKFFDGKVPKSWLKQSSQLSKMQLLRQFNGAKSLTANEKQSPRPASPRG